MKPTTPSSFPSALAGALVAVAAACLPLAAQADVIRGATAIRTTPGHPLANRAIGTANLSAAYTSGETDFDDYVATTTYSGAAAVALANANFQIALNFDLGAEYDINRLVFWQSTTGALRVSSVALYSDSNNSFADGTLASLGTFTDLDNPSSVAGTLYATVLTLPSTVHARYFDFVYTSSASGTSLGRVAFSEVPATPVPEPAPLAFMAAGLGVLAAAARRKRATAGSRAA